jgi:hypothetical protein
MSDFNARLVQLISMHGHIQIAIANHLTHDDSFLNRATNKTAERVRLDFKPIVDELVYRQLESWWANRESLIKQLIRAEINSEERKGITQATALTSVLEGLLTPGIQRAIDEAVTEQLKAQLNAPSEINNG